MNRCGDRPGRRRQRLSHRAGLSLLAVVVLIPACGGEPADRAADQPVTEATTFGYGRFDELPRFDRSESLGPPTEKAGAVSQSFRAEGATPGQILDFYARRLKDTGWDVVEPVHELGEGTVRGRWAEPTWMLTVSAASAPTLTAPEGASQAYSQYSLNLRPAEVPAAEGAPDRSATPAVEDTAGFEDRNFSVTPVRDYDPIPDRTIFSWEVTGDGPAEHILIVACREVPVVFGAGPTGPPAAPQPVSEDATGRTGLTWKPGNPGTYTAEYEGAVAFADLVIKNGAGSRRVRAGTVPCADAPA